MGRGIPLPSRVGGLKERRKLPQRGPGHSPAPQVHFGELLAAETFLMAIIFTVLAYERRDKIVGNT